MQNASGTRADLLRAPPNVLPEWTKPVVFGLVPAPEKRRLSLLTVTNVGRAA